MFLTEKGSIRPQESNPQSKKEVQISPKEPLNKFYTAIIVSELLSVYDVSINYYNMDGLNMAKKRRQYMLMQILIVLLFLWVLHMRLCVISKVYMVNCVK